MHPICSYIISFYGSTAIYTFLCSYETNRAHVVFSSDRLQEFRQKLLEQRAAEVATRATEEPVPSKTEREEECSVKEGQDGESPVEEKASETKEDQLKEEDTAEVSAIVTTNGHVKEPAEQNPEEKTAMGDSGDTDRPASEAEQLTGQGNGEAVVQSTGEVTETTRANEEECVTQNGGVEPEEAVDEVEKSGSDEDGSPDITADQSELKNEEASADVVLSKASLVKSEGDITTDETGEGDITVNGVAEGSIAANGTAEE